MRNPAALAAIESIAQDKECSQETREQALTHLGLHERPTEKTVETLERFAQAEKDPSLKEHAVLSLGGAMGKLSNSEPDSTVAKRALADLGSSLNAAQDGDERSMYLRAIGNAGGRDSLEWIRPYLGSADPIIRAQAVLSLRFVPGEAAEQLMLSALYRDPEPGVRTAAIQAASFRNATPAIVTAAVAGLHGDNDEWVRSSIVSYLAMNPIRTMPEVGAALLWASENDPSPKIREAAVQAIGGA